VVMKWSRLRRPGHAECTGEVRNAPIFVENLERKRPFGDLGVDERIRLKNIAWRCRLDSSGSGVGSAKMVTNPLCSIPEKEISWSTVQLSPSEDRLCSLELAKSDVDVPK
jgi:hypothetical protein